MGQYYYVVNLDKREYLHPHKFGDGLKLMEFANSAEGVLCGLAVLLADGNGRGGGDLGSEDPLVGSWAGDRVVIAGDYADGGKFVDEALAAFVREHAADASPDDNLHRIASECFGDISDDVIRAVARAERRHGHALARLDLADDGWRRPRTEPGEAVAEALEQLLYAARREGGAPWDAEEDPGRVAVDAAKAALVARGWSPDPSGRLVPPPAPARAAGPR